MIRACTLFFAMVAVSLAWCNAPVRAATSPNDSVAAGGTTDIAAYSDSIRAAARSLEAAARAGAQTAPSVHVPPAPLPGPPRYSPSLDDWLQAVLVAARHERPKFRSVMLRDTAAALRYAILSAHSPVTQPTRAVGATLAAILANPAYHEAESSEQAKVEKSWWERFLEWLDSMFDRLLSGLSSAAAGVPLLGQIVAVLAIAVIAGLILLMCYRLARYLVSRRRAARTRDGGELIETLEPPEALYARAREAAAAGRFGAAVTLVFRAGLQQLDAFGLIPYDASRTAGEYRREVRRSCSPAAPPFDELARSFTLAAYAEIPVGERDWLGADEAYQTFTPRVAATRAPETVARS